MMNASVSQIDSDNSRNSIPHAGDSRSTTRHSKRLSIRWRLTLWYAGSLGVLLVGFGILVWAMTNSWLLSQSDLELTEELAELLDAIHSSDSDSLTESVADWSQLHEPYGFDFEVRMQDGTPLMKSVRLQQSGETLFTPGDVSDTSRNLHLTELGPVRVKVADIVIASKPHRLWIAASLDEQQQLLHQLGTVLILAGLMVMAGAGWGGWILARRVLQPIDEIASAAARISAHQLSERVPVENPHDELGRLARTLNTMLDRLNQSFGELKRFTADAAHELRTPLTLLRNELEVTLRKPRSASEYEKSLRSALDDTDRISRVAAQLLELARDDSGTRPIVLERVPITALLTDVTSQLKPQAESNEIHVELTQMTTVASSDDGKFPDEIAVQGDCLRLRRLFLNLLDNAVKYTAAGGWIRVHQQLEKSVVRVIIEDNGCGIAPQHLPHVFDRFYRIDHARTSSTGGTGLGLAICRGIVLSHGGSIEIVSESGQGTKVFVLLPILAST